jgi:hypothetical protein
VSWVRWATGGELVTFSLPVWFVLWVFLVRRFPCRDGGAGRDPPLDVAAVGALCGGGVFCLL